MSRWSLSGFQLFSDAAISVSLHLKLKKHYDSGIIPVTLSR